MASIREKAAIHSILHEMHYPPVIVELGANCGEDEEWIRAFCSRGHQAHYVMVEPDVRNAQFIVDKPTSRARRVILGACASYNGMIQFHACENQKVGDRASGSIRQPTGHVVHFPEVVFNRSTWVPCFTLDEICKRERLDHIDLLWVDIQGAEKDMIEGGRKTLEQTKYLFMEAEPEVELYAGQALKSELIAMLPEWVMVEDFGYNVFMRNTRCT